MGSGLEARRRDPVFLSQPSPTVLLGSDFVIRAATPSYLEATGRHEDELVSVNVFDAFPENPASTWRGDEKLVDALAAAIVYQVGHA